jgi:hypothetical protein
MGHREEDLAAVRRDDTLLDALGQGAMPKDPDPVEALLVGWRRELLAPPVRDLVTVEDAMAAFRVARRPSRLVRWWRRVRRPTTTRR